MTQLNLIKNSSFCICFVNVAIILDNTSYNALSKQLERACCFIDT